MLDAPDDVANVASQAASTVACKILTNIHMLTGGQSMRTAKAANPVMEAERKLNSSSNPSTSLSPCR